MLNKTFPVAEKRNHPHNRIADPLRPNGSPMQNMRGASQIFSCIRGVQPILLLYFMLSIEMATAKTSKTCQVFAVGHVDVMSIYFNALSLSLGGLLALRG
jgi:hypothetical protein